MDWDSLVMVEDYAKTEDGINEMSYSEFITELEWRLDGKKYKSEKCPNYPMSTWFYLADDDVMEDEIAIYTQSTAWGIFIDRKIRFKRFDKGG